MSNRIPKKIRIKDIDYVVNLIENKEDVNPLKDDIYHGQFNPEIGEIRLWNNPNKNILTHTLLHEITHGLMYAIDENEKYGDEKFIEKLSNAIHMLLRDNDLRFIYEGDENVK